jgi:hypothetical protein
MQARQTERNDLAQPLPPTPKRVATVRVAHRTRPNPNHGLTQKHFDNPRNKKLGLDLRWPKNQSLGRSGYRDAIPPFRDEPDTKSQTQQHSLAMHLPQSFVQGIPFVFNCEPTALTCSPNHLLFGNTAAES